MTNEEYLTKLRAETHIDEISETSRKGQNIFSDTKNHKFAKDGFNYRTAYFEDFDGQYYKLTISVGINGSINTVYNIGKIKKTSMPSVAQRPFGIVSAGGNSSNNTVPQSGTGVNSNSMQKSEKDTEKSKNRFSLKEDYDKSITTEDISSLHSIGRKNVNDFTDGDVKATQKWANKFYKELGAKSPFFRAWFGDWREYDISPVTVAVNKGSDRGLQHNNDTGWDINVSGKVFSETNRHTYSKNVNARAYIPYINDIIRNAISLDSYTIDKLKSENSLFMHSMYAVADVGQGAEVLKIYVEEMNNPNAVNTSKRTYQIQDIIKASEVNGGVQTKSPISHANTTNAAITVSDLFSLVKQNDKYYKPKQVNSTLLNEDGTPKVFYHQTGADFTEFNTDNQTAGKFDS